MRFGRLHVIVTYLLAGAGLLALSLGDELGLVSALLVFVGFVASLFAGPKLLSRPRYTATWNIVMVSFLVLQIARAFGDAAILQLGIEFAAALQIAKLFHRIGARDYQHVQALALLHLVAATVLTTGFEYALIFLIFVVVLPWMLALTHLRGEIEIHYVEPESKAPPGLGPPSAKAKEVLRSRRIAGAGFLGWTAALSVPLFLVTAAFFTLFPRVGMGFLSLGESTGRRVAGFGPDVQLGGFGVIRDDTTVVLRVKPSDHRPGAANNETFRLRGTSFDRYEDARWSRSETPPRGLQELMGFYQLLRRDRQSATRELEIVLDPLDEQVLFLPPGAIGVYIAPRVEAGRESYRRLDLSAGWDLRYRESDGLEVRYSVAIDEEMDTIPEPLEAEDVERYLQLPDGNERITALARRIAGSGSPREQVLRIETWLRASGTFEYTLEMPDTRGHDPLEVFLFDARRGHCEYFSSALAVMLRSLGVPARNVTGFVGGVYNRYGGYYAIRQGDAHSWVEAYIDGAWRTYDPTPAAHMSAAPRGEGFLADIRAALDAMRMRWARDIVGYDLRDQVEGLRAAFRWFRELRQGDNVQSGERGLVEERRNGSAAWLPIVGAMLILSGLSYLLWRRRKRKKKEGPGKRAQRGESARDLYERLERRLARRGVGRPKTKTPREHLATLEAAHDEDVELARAITKAYEAGRLGGASNQEELRELRRRL